MTGDIELVALCSISYTQAPNGKPIKRGDKYRLSRAKADIHIKRGWAEPVAAKPAK